MLKNEGRANKYTFHKKERLCSKKEITELFEQGSSFKIFPIKVIYKITKDYSGDHKVLFTVSSRNFKKAVDRNKIKRRLREAYRLNKPRYLGVKKDEFTLNIAYIYIGRKVFDYQFLEERLIASLTRLKEISS